MWPSHRGSWASCEALLVNDDPEAARQLEAQLEEAEWELAAQEETEQRQAAASGADGDNHGARSERGAERAAAVRAQRRQQAERLRRVQFLNAEPLMPPDAQIG